MQAASKPSALDSGRNDQNDGNGFEEKGRRQKKRVWGTSLLVI